MKEILLSLSLPYKKEACEIVSKYGSSTLVFIRVSENTAKNFI
jgi:hypothetical protein